MVAHLNWRRSSPFAVLHGTLFPEGLSTENLQNIPSLSAHSNVSYEDMICSGIMNSSQDRALFARRDVSRGLSQDEVAAYNVWSKTYELREPFLMWCVIYLPI